MARNKKCNVKYKSLDDMFFDIIDTELKAYFLGWLASDVHLSKDGKVVRLSVHEKDRHKLNELRDAFCKELPISNTSNKTTKMVRLSICSKNIHRSICKHLQVTGGKKSSLVKFPALQNKELTFAFIRGLFDGDGFVKNKNFNKQNYKTPICGITSNSLDMIDGIRKFANIKSSFSKSLRRDKPSYNLTYCGNNALDFMSRIYDYSEFRLERKYALYIDWSCWVPAIKGKNCRGKSLHFRWCKSDSRAQAPFKIRASDSGWDLTLIQEKERLGDTIIYDTGVKICPEYGWYFDLVARSSLSKTGYILSNCLGIIDRSYIGPILVALTKIDKTQPDLELPLRAVQIVPRPIIHFEFKLVNDIEETERGDEGFGSTGK